MEINPHRRQTVVAQPISTNTVSLVKVIAPIKPIANDSQHSTGDWHAKLAAMPEVDRERVALTQTAIQTGEITLNSADIAKAILNVHRG